MLADITAPSASPITTTLSLLVLGALQGLSLWLSNRNHKKLKLVTKGQEQIYDLVNHPMGVAMSNLAVALETIAKATGNAADVQAAKDARERSDEHESKQAIADVKKRRDVKGTDLERICLVVEDNAIDRELLINAIDHAGWNADIADSAEMAIGLSKNRNYLIAFIDMRFPAMPGEQLFKELRRINPEMKIVIVLGEVSDLKKIESSTYFCCIIKPPSASSVALALNNILNAR